MSRRVVGRGHEFNESRGPSAGSASPTPYVGGMTTTTLVPPLVVRLKPRLRGVSHQIACGIALVAGLVLVSQVAPGAARVTAIVYTLCLTALFGFSAAYHRPHWSPKARSRMERLDHAGIYLLIAGTYTPISLALPPAQGNILRAVAWTGALVGTLQSTFWMSASKPLVAAIYVALGWAVLPFLGSLYHGAGPGPLALLLGGGVVYSLGAVVYARKRPDPVPTVFGYHEVFHAMVVLAAVIHFGAVVLVLRNFPRG